MRSTVHHQSDCSATLAAGGVLALPTEIKDSTFQLGFVDDDGKEWFGASALQLLGEETNNWHFR